MHPKVIDKMTNSLDPDQTAAAQFDLTAWIHTVCSDCPSKTLKFKSFMVHILAAW